MKKTLIILCREYRLRLRRPAFWVLTLLVPLLLAALYAIPVIAAHGTHQRTTVLVVDESTLFLHNMQSTDEVAFQPQPDLDHARQRMAQADSISAILFIPKFQNGQIPREAFLYQRDNTPPSVAAAANSQLQLLLRRMLLADIYAQLDPDQLGRDSRHSVEVTGIRVHTLDIDTGRENFSAVKTVAATVLAVLMVLALLVFGIQVMRSV